LTIFELFELPGGEKNFENMYNRLDRRTDRYLQTA